MSSPIEIAKLKNEVNVKLMMILNSQDDRFTKSQKYYQEKIFVYFLVQKNKVVLLQLLFTELCLECLKDEEMF